MTRVAVVIPAYNEAGTIRDIAERVLRQCPWLIVVDDGSTDDTSGQLSGLPLSLLRNPRNRGKGASLWRGIDQALQQGADVVVTLDGDGQHLPEDIPRLVAPHERYRNAVVIGSRMSEKRNIPRDRYLANAVGNFCIGWAARQAIEDSQSGFRSYSTALFRMVEVRTDRAGGFVFETEMLIDAARAGALILTVPIAAIYEQRGRRSHFRPIPDFTRIGWMVTCKIVSRGFDLPGLFKSLKAPEPKSRDG